MKQRFKVGFVTLMLAALTIPADALNKEELGSVTGIASFTTGGVNLRKGPSTSEPYLIYIQGQELYFDAENVGWSDELGHMTINGRRIQPDHEKLQGMEGDRCPVIGSQGDWVKLDYLGHEVWTMKKFLKISPLAPISTSMTYTPYGYNSLNVTGTEDGAPALLFQEGGMDEDQGFYVGHVEKNIVVFDYFIPFGLYEEPTLKGNAQLSKSPSDEYYKLKIGPHQMLKEHSAPNVKSFSSEQIKDLVKGKKKLPANEDLILVNTASGAFQL